MLHWYGRLSLLLVRLLALSYNPSFPPGLITVLGWRHWFMHRPPNRYSRQYGPKGGMGAFPEEHIAGQIFCGMGISSSCAYKYICSDEYEAMRGDTKYNLWMSDHEHGNAPIYWKWAWSSWGDRAGYRDFLSSPRKHRSATTILLNSVII